MSNFLAIVGMLVAVVAWLVVSSRRASARSEKELAAFAQQGGFRQERYTLRLVGRDLSVTYRDFWPELAGEFRLSGRKGVHTTIDHVLRQPWDGGEVTLFDYSTNNGDIGQAALFESAKLDLPRFTVHPGDLDLGSLGPVGAWVASRPALVMLGDLAVVTADRARVERLFTPEIVAFFQLRQPGGRTWAEGGGRHLLYYKLWDDASKRLNTRADLPADAGIGGFWAGAQDLYRLLADTAARLA